MKNLKAILLTTLICALFASCSSKPTYEEGYHEGYEKGYSEGFQEDHDKGFEEASKLISTPPPTPMPTPTPTPSPTPPDSIEELEKDENFIYSWNCESYDGSESPIEYMNSLYDGMINATYFIYDTKTQYIHFSSICPHITDIASTRYDAKNFYEAIIYQYNYCQECFQPLIDYYQDNN